MHQVIEIIVTLVTICGLARFTFINHFAVTVSYQHFFLTSDLYIAC
jgi:hypothetical protein